MSKNTASADGGAMPAADHPDAALFALARRRPSARERRLIRLERIAAKLAILRRALAG